MSQFIRTSIGFLNLDHILLIRVGIEREEGEDLVQMSDGRTIHCRIEDRSFLPQPKPPVIVTAQTEAPAIAATEAETAVGRWGS